MEFTKLERLMLINQFEILKTLRPDEKEQHEEFIEILNNGYKIFYPEIMGWMDEDFPIDESRFVLDLLDLYRAIENFKRINNVEEINNHVWGHFYGFDGNDEGGYLAFSRFLIDKQHKFQEQEQYRNVTDDFNSHSNTLNNYKNMVAKWIKLDKKFELNKAEILEILNS